MCTGAGPRPLLRRLHRHRAGSIEAPPPRRAASARLVRSRPAAAPRRRASGVAPPAPDARARSPAARRSRHVRRPARRDRRAQPARPGDGAVGVVGERPRHLRVVLVHRDAPGHLARRRRRGLRRRDAAVDYHRWRRWTLPAPRPSPACCWRSCSCPGVGMNVNGVVAVARATARSRSSRRSSPSSRSSCSSPTCWPGGRRGWPTCRLTLRAGRRACSASSPLLLMLQPNLGTTLVLGAIVLSRALRRRARPLHPAAGVGVGGAVVAHGSGARRELPAGPGARRSSTRGPTRSTPATRTSSRSSASPSGGLTGRRPRREPGQVGLPARTPTPTSSSPSSARSSACSAPLVVVGLFVALCVLGARAAPARPPTASACCSPPASPPGSACRRS